MLRRVNKAINYPNLVYSWLRKRKGIELLTGASGDEVARVKKQLKSHKKLLDHIQNSLKGAGFTGVVTYWQSELYVICRLSKPHIVVETGVEHGISTYFILQALRDNCSGHLYSIDIPPPEIQSGWLVPVSLRSRWTLVIGKSADKLRPLLFRIGNIDLFLHDSEHSYTNMMQEFITAWPYIKQGGILIADDASRNDAFPHFVRLIERPPIMTPTGKKAVKK